MLKRRGKRRERRGLVPGRQPHTTPMSTSVEATGHRIAASPVEEASVRGKSGFSIGDGCVLRVKGIVVRVRKLTVRVVRIKVDLEVPHTTDACHTYTTREPLALAPKEEFF